MKRDGWRLFIENWWLATVSAPKQFPQHIIFGHQRERTALCEHNSFYYYLIEKRERENECEEENSICMKK